MIGSARKINELKKHILQVAHNSGEGHIASSFSVLDILYILHNFYLNADDHFILSKGHASLALYSVLYDHGDITLDEFYSFCQFDSRLGGHPSRNKLKNIVASTGSLGHGLPIAIGLALSKKIKKEPGKVYCLIGDGEANEGTIWESALLAGHHKLDNLVCIVDNNDSSRRALDMGSFSSKFLSFGWDADHVIGHNHFGISDCLSKNSTKPCFIEAFTTKGYGCKSMENNPAWHHRSPNSEELQILLGELTEHEKTIY